MAEDVVIPIEVVLKGGLSDSIDFRWYIILLFYIHTYFYRRFLPKMQYGGCFVLQPRIAGTVYTRYHKTLPWRDARFQTGDFFCVTFV